MEHLNAARDATETKYNNKDLNQRVLGKFYTPKSIGSYLAAQICERFELEDRNELVLCDPFAGDGRMISFLLEELQKINIVEKLNKITILLFELDNQAILNLESCSDNLMLNYGKKLEIKIENCDSLTSSEVSNCFDKVDLLITNPPWELLKPDTREMGNMSKESGNHYINSLREYDKKLAMVLPFSQPKKKFAGWGTNLSRCGFELSAKLIRPKGILGIVLPSSVFSDQMSEPLRKNLFNSGNLENINFYPAASKAFQDVDQDFISCVYSNNENQNGTKYQLNVFNSELQLDVTENIELDIDFLKKNEFQIPLEHGKEFVEILRILSEKSKLSFFEKSNCELSLYAGREMDETGLENKLKNEGLRFIKGRSVLRYGFSSEKDMFLDHSLSTKSFNSINHPRLVWRDVARKSQIRRIQSMVIPEGILTGNSLHIIYSKSQNLAYLKALSVIFNSMVFEAQVRSKLSTNHISLGVVRCCHLPSLNEEIIDELSRMYDINLKTNIVLAEIESIVCEIYGLNNSHLQYLAIKFFPNDEITKIILGKSINQ